MPNTAAICRIRTKRGRSACADENETTTVEKASPGIATEATRPAIVGEKIKDVATLSGLVSPDGTGEVSFDLYKGEDCSEENFLETLGSADNPVNANGEYTSDEFDTTASGAGTYHWIAHFSGDSNNKPVDGECEDENETTVVEKASPEIATEATPTAIVGEKIKDVATLSGLISPDGTGEVSFDLYKGEDCSEENSPRNPRLGR